jgi:hypothetical protein
MNDEYRIRQQAIQFRVLVVHPRSIAQQALAPIPPPLSAKVTFMVYASQ